MNETQNTRACKRRRRRRPREEELFCSLHCLLFEGKNCIFFSDFPLNRPQNDRFGRGLKQRQFQTKYIPFGWQCVVLRLQNSASLLLSLLSCHSVDHFKFIRARRNRMCFCMCTLFTGETVACKKSGTFRTAKCATCSVHV